MADWCALTEDVISLIVRRLQHVEDFLAFRCTCKSWRAATSLKDFDTSCPKLPLLILNPTTIKREQYCSSNGKAWMNVNEEEREIFSIYRNKISRIWLPEAKTKTCIGGSRGWLIMFGSSGDMSLLHPITRSHILLPDSPIQLHANNGDYSDHCLRAVLSASPSHTSDYVVLVAFREEGYRTHIRYWKSQDSTWTVVECPTRGHLFNYMPVLDITFNNGKFYALTMDGICQQVWVCDVSGPNPKELIPIIILPTRFSTGYDTRFVECDDGGRLLVVTPSSKNRTPLPVVELDVIGGTCTDNYTSLGNIGTVFLGANTAGFNVDATRFPEIVKPYHIYISNGSLQEATIGFQRNHVHETGRFYPSKISGAWVTPNL